LSCPHKLRASVISRLLPYDNLSRRKAAETGG